MIGWFQDPGGPKTESTREGPWELAIRSAVSKLTPKRLADGSILWLVVYTKGDPCRYLPEERTYWFDWEGDFDLALREQIYAAQIEANEVVP